MLLALLASFSLPAQADLYVEHGNLSCMTVAAGITEGGVSGCISDEEGNTTCSFWYKEDGVEHNYLVNGILSPVQPLTVFPLFGKQVVEFDFEKFQCFFRLPPNFRIIDCVRGTQGNIHKAQCRVFEKLPKDGNIMLDTVTIDVRPAEGY
ncbi:hypothetical protein H7X87_03055 [Acetobacteraceae bacterium]|nr:hypothetical protein [Candidatus Parcubacteria bacterium]